MIGRRSLLLAGAALPASVSAYGQCVTDVAAVDACFGGVRLTVPQGATLDLNFLAAPLDPRITFTRASTATYFDATGTMQTAAINAPRWDYDPVTHALRGLLLEDQGTNGVRNSTDISAVVPGTPGTAPANWAYNAGPTGLTVQTVGAGVESGIPYVDIRFFGTVGTAGGSALITDTATAIVAATGQTWTGSIYWRIIAGSANGLTTSSLSLRENTSAGALVRDNPVTLANPANASLSAQRIAATVALSGGATTARVQARYTNNFSAGAAVDVTIRVGGPQVEQSPAVTSFIPTTTAAVTRNIDSCLIPSANMAWFTSPGGSWFAEFMFMAPAPSNSRIIGRPDTVGGVSPYLLAATRTGAQNDGASVATTNAGTAIAITKGASAWAAGQAKVCLNGGPVASGAALATGYGVFTTSGVRFMSVGAALSTDNTSGWLRRVAYWPRVLTDAEMLSMTA